MSTRKVVGTGVIINGARGQRRQVKMEWATATAALFGPRRRAMREYCAEK